MQNRSRSGLPAMASPTSAAQPIAAVKTDVTSAMIVAIVMEAAADWIVYLPFVDFKHGV